MDEHTKRLPELPSHQEEVWWMGVSENFKGRAAKRYYTAEQMREYATAAITALGGGWLPIESAPRDGSWLIVGWNDGGVDKAFWSGAAWADNEGDYAFAPNYFLPHVPLPAPPSKEE